LATALAALIDIAAQEDPASIEAFREEFDVAFGFLAERELSEVE
jgi:hypothetical protein